MPKRATLWAPWRMEYILGPKGGACIFCQFPRESTARRRERLILCEREHAFVIMNRYPFGSCHVMVVPRTHASDLSELGAAEYDGLFALVRDATRALRAAAGCDGLNVGINLGAAAGAGIAEHLHVHLVPRWKGDLNFMPIVADVRVMPEALDAAWSRLRPHFAPLDEPGVPTKSPRPVAPPAPKPRRGTPKRGRS